MTREEAVRILYEMLSKAANSGGELGGLAVQMAVEALKKQEEPVSEDLEVAASKYAHNLVAPELYGFHITDAFKDGANWQKTKSIVDACYHLEMRLPEYLYYNGTTVERNYFINDFRKALEED